MKSDVLGIAGSLILIAGVAFGQPSDAHANQKVVRYRLIDMGTLGGPIGYGDVNGFGYRSSLIVCADFQKLSNLKITQHALSHQSQGDLQLPAS